MSNKKTAIVINAPINNLYLFDMGAGGGVGEIIPDRSAKVYRVTSDIAKAINYADQQQRRLHDIQTSIERYREDAADTVDQYQTAECDIEKACDSAADAFAQLATLIEDGEVAIASYDAAGETIDDLCESFDTRIDEISGERCGANCD